jgi:hypothetical protein
MCKKNIGNDFTMDVCMECSKQERRKTMLIKPSIA